MTKILTVVGARPQFVKAAVVSAALARAGARETLIHTGQHYDAALSSVFFEELSLPPPAHHLGIGGLSHGAMTGRMLEALEGLISSDRPDWVLVYGDTNSTLAGALAAVKLHVPVAHVEAGMRSFNRRMPEEINRVVTDHVASLHLVTGERPARLLEAEGVREGVHVVGDVMLDACRAYRPAAEKRAAARRLGLEGRPFGLVTLHRAENTDDPARLGAIAEALERVARRLPLVVPIHPRARKALERQGLALRGVRTIDPVGYLDMLDLETRASLVLTDSGGVQKEAFWAGVPCVTLRAETEWVETVELGWNALSGADPDAIEREALRAVDAPPREPRPAVYGDGHAADRIADILLRASG